MAGYCWVRNELLSSCQNAGCAFNRRSQKDGNLPDGGAVFRGLAVVEAQLLERLGERLFERHGCVCVWIELNVPIDQVTLSRQSTVAVVQTEQTRGLAETLQTNSALAPHCGIGSFSISPESSSISSDARSFPSSATSLTSPLSHTKRQQPCRSEPVSVSSMPSANRLPTPASPSQCHVNARPQPTPMPESQDLLSLAFNSSGRLPSVLRLSTSGLLS